jgi:hypothetical protein
MQLLKQLQRVPSTHRGPQVGTDVVGILSAFEYAGVVATPTPSSVKLQTLHILPVRMAITAS